MPSLRNGSALALTEVVTVSVSEIWLSRVRLDAPDHVRFQFTSVNRPASGPSMKPSSWFGVMVDAAAEPGAKPKKSVKSLSTAVLAAEVGLPS